MGQVNGTATGIDVDLSKPLGGSEVAERRGLDAVLGAIEGASADGVVYPLTAGTHGLGEIKDMTGRVIALACDMQGECWAAPNQPVAEELADLANLGRMVRDFRWAGRVAGPVAARGSTLLDLMGQPLATFRAPDVAARAASAMNYCLAGITAMRRAAELARSAKRAIAAGGAADAGLAEIIETLERADLMAEQRAAPGSRASTELADRADAVRPPMAASGVCESVSAFEEETAADLVDAAARKSEGRDEADPFETR